MKEHSIPKGTDGADSCKTKIFKICSCCHISHNRANLRGSTQVPPLLTRDIGSHHLSTPVEGQGCAGHGLALGTATVAVVISSCLLLCFEGIY